MKSRLRRAKTKARCFGMRRSRRVLPHFASAHCQAGTLIVNLAGKPPRDFMSRILDRTLGAENYHPIEYQLFYGNLRHNAKVRVEAYLRTHSGIVSARTNATFC
jgi:hypothetical protein